MSEPQIFAIPSAGPDESVVAELGRLLDEARKGRIRAIVAVYDTGPEIDQVWCGRFDRFQMLGMLSRLAHRIQLNMDDASEEG